MFRWLERWPVLLPYLSAFRRHYHAHRAANSTAVRSIMAAAILETPPSQDYSVAEDERYQRARRTLAKVALRQLADEYARAGVVPRAECAMANDPVLACDLESAKDELGALINEDPEFSEAHYLLGVAHREQSSIEAAIAAFRAAAAGQVRLPRYYYDIPIKARVNYELGLMLAESGNKTEAESCYRCAVEVQHDFARAQLALGKVLAERGCRREAAHHMMLAIRGYGAGDTPPPVSLADERTPH